MIKQNEYGRSMMEMLGVLSIIGVMSAGGIAGYSTAMNKIKINNAIEQVNLLASKISKLGEHGNTDDDGGIYNGLSSSVAIKLKAIDTKYVSGTNLSTPFGGSLTISATNANDNFTITYNDLTKDQCTTLATQDWNMAGNSNLLGVSVAKSTTHTAITIGCSASVQNGEVIGCANSKSLPIKVADAVKGCSCTSQTCSIQWTFF